MINLLINGANGKMGKKVYEATLNTNNVKAVCGVDVAENFSNESYPIYKSFDDVKEKVDVIVDFSHPSALNSLLEYALNNCINAVFCSTGYTQTEVALINRASQKIAIFRSANMSLGANVLINLVKNATSALSGFDVEIIEKHHNKKADAPSGTALMLADAVKAILPEKFFVFGRQGQTGKRAPDEVGIHAVRGGNLVGEHEVIFAGENEVVSLSHQAFDRSVFAFGAVVAVQYIHGKKAGLYNMNDLLCNK